MWEIIMRILSFGSLWKKDLDAIWTAKEWEDATTPFLWKETAQAFFNTQETDDTTSEKQTIK